MKHEQPHRESDLPTTRGAGGAAKNAENPPRRARVLLVDDEADLCELVTQVLVGMGLEVDAVGTLLAASRLLAQNVSNYALCLTDMCLPDGDGLSLVSLVQTQKSPMPVVVVTAFGSPASAVAALKAGAFDYLTKPVGLTALRNLVRSALRVSKEGRDASQKLCVSGGERCLLGDSLQMNNVRDKIQRLARSMAPVAITGESGVGKELAARLVHQQGARARGPFIAINCGAIPEHLMESEFFGHRKGAFTGADQHHEGFFQAAQGGTLFLDEVAELPLLMQVKLLRAIQEKQVRRVGEATETSVDVRIISATHQDLAECVKSGKFRQDLFYRLNVIELAVPALRERLEDVPILVDAILARLARQTGARGLLLSEAALHRLMQYNFPGNIRELENLLERAVALASGPTIELQDLGLPGDVTEAASQLPAQAEFAQSAAAEAAEVSELAMVLPRVPEVGEVKSLPDYLVQIERNLIVQALQRAKGRLVTAAHLLGLSPRALRYRIQRLQLGKVSRVSS